jgi:hypothetical protein
VAEPLYEATERLREKQQREHRRLVKTILKVNKK